IRLHEARISLHIRGEDGRQLALCCRDLLVLEIRHGFLTTGATVEIQSQSAVNRKACMNARQIKLRSKGFAILTPLANQNVVLGELAWLQDRELFQQLFS